MKAPLRLSFHGEAVVLGSKGGGSGGGGAFPPLSLGSRPALELLSVRSQVDGVSYLLQEIYGIENKYNTQESKASSTRHSGCVLPTGRVRKTSERAGAQGCREPDPGLGLALAG